MIMLNASPAEIVLSRQNLGHRARLQHNRSRDIQPDVRLSPHPAQATPSGSDRQSPYDPLPVRRAASPAGPLTTTRAAVSSLSIGWRLIGVVFWWAHPDHVSALPSPGTRPGIRPVMRDDQLEGLVLLSRFPVAFRLPALAFWSSCSRPGSWALLTVGLPANGRTPTGFPRFARTSCDRGGCPLYSGDNGAHPDRSRSPASVRRITATCPYAPPQHPIDTGLCFTKHQPRVQNDFTRPIFPSPVAPGWSGRPWA